MPLDTDPTLTSEARQVGQRCARLLSSRDAPLDVSDAYRMACNAALSDLADTIAAYAHRLYTYSHALHAAVGWNSFLSLRPITDTAFRAEAHRWADEIQTGGTRRPDPDTYITARQRNARTAWRELSLDVEAALAAAMALVGDIPDHAVHLGEDTDTCSDCAGTGECGDCEGTGCDPDGDECENCQGSGECPACRTADSDSIASER
ncbi:hypothetical protein [Nocardia terpenica]|uniref:Uncharacterized protein n=1 Tax=Nocardia terpenica TaxID=455432 RepID=A0A164K720_9NOCA|nr:hypothetical protein [Nocardia terpenica]KZM71103.1 hypothetical protein AWN90_42075 [Nocardia terpenica]